MIASVFKLSKLCFLPALCTQLQPGLPWAPLRGGYQHCHAVPCDILQCHAILPLLRPNLAALDCIIAAYSALLLHHAGITASSCQMPGRMTPCRWQSGRPSGSLIIRKTKQDPCKG